MTLLRRKNSTRDEDQAEEPVDEARPDQPAPAQPEQSPAGPGRGAGWLDAMPPVPEIGAVTNLELSRGLLAPHPKPLPFEIPEQITHPDPAPAEPLPEPGLPAAEELTVDAPVTASVARPEPSGPVIEIGPGSFRSAFARFGLGEGPCPDLADWLSSDVGRSDLFNKETLRAVQRMWRLSPAETRDRVRDVVDDYEGCWYERFGSFPDQPG